MKEIDVGDEVLVKNEKGTYKVLSWTYIYSFYYGNSDTISHYKVQATDSARILYVNPHEITPTKSIKQKIDDLLDTYNQFLQAEEVFKDGFFKKQAEFLINQLKGV